MKMNLIKIRKRYHRPLIYCLIVTVFVTTACSSSIEDNGSLVSIDLLQAIQTKQELPISKFIDSLEYIPLEFTPGSEIGGGLKLYLTNEYIVVRNYTKEATTLLLLFDRKNGEFIRHIGNRGRGPEEYIVPLDCFYNPYDNNIYTRGEKAGSIKVYNLEGKFLESYYTPELNEPSIKSAYIPLSIDAFFNSNNFIGYIENSTGMINNRLAIFSKDEVINSFPNFITWPSEDSKKQYVTYYQNPIFFSWQENVYFKESSNDTLFYITKNKLVPRLLLNSGDYRVPYRLTRDEAIKQLDNPEDYLDIRNIFENPKYIFFDLYFKLNPDFVSPFEPDQNKTGIGKPVTYMITFNKLTKEILVSQNLKTKVSAFKDDIYDFMPISPLLITRNNEMIAYLNARDIIKWKVENPEKLDALNTKLPWLEKLNELDNPVIVIGKCKD